MKTQKQRVLELLQRRGKKGVRCWEFSKISPAIMQYVTRIWELRHKDGYNIECILGRDAKKKQRTSLYILKNN